MRVWTDSSCCCCSNTSRTSMPALGWQRLHQKLIQAWAERRDSCPPPPPPHPVWQRWQTERGSWTLVRRSTIPVKVPTGPHRPIWFSSLQDLMLAISPNSHWWSARLHQLDQTHTVCTVQVYKMWYNDDFIWMFVLKFHSIFLLYYIKVESSPGKTVGKLKYVWLQLHLFHVIMTNYSHYYYLPK